MYDLGFRRAVRLLYDCVQSMLRVARVMRIAQSTVCRWIRDPTPSGWPYRGLIAVVAFVRHKLSVEPVTTSHRLRAARSQGGPEPRCVQAARVAAHLISSEHVVEAGSQEGHQPSHVARRTALAADPVQD